MPDAKLFALKVLVIPEVELGIRSANASSTRISSSVPSDPYKMIFSGDTDVLVLTASSKSSSNENLDGVDEARGNLSIEADKLPVSEKNFDRQTS